MTIWLALWALVVIGEHMLYIAVGQDGMMTRKTARRTLGAFMMLAVVVASLLMLTADWRLWMLPALITPYRLINIARMVRYRLQPGRLSSLSLRTHAWLVFTQLVFLGISYGCS